MRQYGMRGLVVVLGVILLAGCGAAGRMAPVTPIPPAAGKTTPVVTTTPAGAGSPTRVTNGATPTPPDQAASPGTGGTTVTNPAAQAAIRELAQQRQVAPADIQVVAVEAVDWPDAALGCPEPGRAYAQVITPGYRIVLEVSGQRVVYHANRSGDRVVTC